MSKAFFAPLLLVVLATASASVIAKTAPWDTIHKRTVDERLAPTVSYLHKHAEILGKGLFSPIQGRLPGTYVLTNFVHLGGRLSSKHAHPHSQLGQELAELLLAFANSYEVRVVEPRIRQDILHTATGLQGLSHDQKLQQKLPSANYTVTGTITVQGDGSLVNGRIIDNATGQIVTAKSIFIPIPRSEQQSVIMRNNRLVRRSLTY
ncbi:FlgO family outer membrane protein [Opacimonas viscosa]|uniref:FlgO family outer membrane protein n=1 Tax=Opacimonas viscosa TaxID=2961944 RepID=A0AA42BP37_9ALTE|nr:FlgO family outer membrane protein [Opacimonas viscosa]MCP3428036.1 FlgO family outer membrane protein [Opacimonas viscosa]